ncbi:vomeronasal type-2 receptor 26-like [Anomaloglossus baeobatrachus]
MAVARWISYGDNYNENNNVPFYSTALGPNIVNKAIIKLLKYFGWTWIAIWTDGEDEFQKTSENLKKESLKNGICVEYTYTILKNFSGPVDRLKSTKSKVIVFNISTKFCRILSYLPAKYSKILILSKQLLSESNYCFLHERYSFIINEAYFIVPQKGNIIGLKEVLQNASPEIYPNKILQNVWLTFFRCVPSDNKFSARYQCKKNYTLTTFSEMEYNVGTFRTTYNVYLAVHAVAHALNNMYMMDKNSGENHGSFIQRISPTQAHMSSCFERCLPGYRKAVNQRIYCCYLCVPCSAGEYTNTMNMEKCDRCPEDEWPNLSNSACLKRPLDFLSFYDLLGTLITLLIVVLYILSVVILVIFIRYRETPIVKANNRSLSYTILISLMLSFLCSLLFIGNPAQLTCLLQNIIFNLVFTVAVSSILAKTITVLIAFNVTKPNYRFGILFKQMSHVFIVFCFIGEFSICICWIYLYPPYPNRDSVSKPGILILYCNLGSRVIYYLALGYNSFFALLCFLVAFFAKKLPDRFNEAHYITFSMVVFCSVWISFIPAHISTKGKYMTAVQIFAILASSTGLLGFIFFPKCYIIIFRQKLNIKKTLYVRSY